MDLGLEGCVAVVTGASKGIGLAITRALVAEGVRVVAGARHGQLLHSCRQMRGLSDHGEIDEEIVADR